MFIDNSCIINKNRFEEKVFMSSHEHTQRKAPFSEVAQATSSNRSDSGLNIQRRDLEEQAQTNEALAQAHLELTIAGNMQSQKYEKRSPEASRSRSEKRYIEDLMASDRNRVSRASQRSTDFTNATGNNNLLVKEAALEGKLTLLNTELSNINRDIKKAKGDAKKSLRKKHTETVKIINQTVKDLDKTKLEIDQIIQEYKEQEKGKGAIEE